jgi:hypothetical protein
MYEINTAQNTEFSQLAQKRNLVEDTQVKADPQPDPKIPINMTGNGLVGFALLFFMIYFVNFMVSFTRDIFVSQQLVRDPIILGKIDG